jgi:hypothetical protein
MAMKMKAIEYGAPTPQILAIPDHYVAFGFKHNRASSGSEGLATLVDGRYVVKAGTIYPANDSTAVGVVLNDYDVTDGDATLAVVIHGFVKTAALPAVPAADAIAALKQIQFVPIGNTITVDYGPVVALTYEVGATEAGTDTVEVPLAGGLTYSDAATSKTNWTITGETTVKATVESITLSADKKVAIFKVKTTSTALVAGSITVKPSAAAISIGKAPSAVKTIVTVAAGAE